MQRYQVIKHRHVKRDLQRAWRYLLADASAAVAERFLKKVEKSFDDLALMRELGTFYESDQPELQSLRQCTVNGFKKYIIFYYANEARHQLHIIRVLHGSLDVGSILELGISPNDL
jgi:toxin ParE1/3/4